MKTMLWSRGETATDWGALGSSATEGAALLRLWRGFIAARCFIAAILLLLHALSWGIGHAMPAAALALSALYLAATLLGRRHARFQAPIRHFSGRDWLLTVGVDLAVFALLQLQHADNINYTPLFALPVLMAAVLGTVPVGFGTAAIVTLLLLADALWRGMQLPGETASRLMQAALSGAGLFAVAFLAHQLALRLAREERVAMRSRSTARMHAQVSDMVIETLDEGVLVIDARGQVLSANPAADAILGATAAERPLPFSLDAQPAWRPLAVLAQQTFAHGRSQAAEIPIAQTQGAPLELSVRTRLTPAPDPRARSLCVMFLQDLRELEARIRTEKLAAMGRMSAAVAHEIRNPLATITQASALLAEDLVEPGQRRLTAMVQHNAQRLARIVDDVLDVSRARQQRLPPPSEQIALGAAVRALAGEWLRQTRREAQVRMDLEEPDFGVRFDAEHLRRILVNLLDNAARYAGAGEDAIRITTRRHGPDGRASLQVWSAGAPLEAAVRRHLFEPFFSSESRSSGLGLFICRELCERHGAGIGYARRPLATEGAEGNVFSISFAPCDFLLTK